ncbi:MAG: pseudouridine synthase [Synechococcus sp.]
MPAQPGDAEAKAERLQKLVAAAGLCSRRHAEKLLREGRISVNGRIAQLGDRAHPHRDRITIDGTPLSVQAPPRLLLLNKPRGVISSCQDPQRRPVVLDLVPKNLRRGLHPIGRLDADSRGALLLTNQGELTLQLTHPRYAHTKTYRVWVRGRPSHAALDQWRRGIPLDQRLTQPAGVRALHHEAHRTLLEIALREGRNRQIRRIAELLGHPVLDLQRIAIATIALGFLQEGHWRELGKREWHALTSPSR